MVLTSLSQQDGEVDLPLRCGTRQCAWCNNEVARPELTGRSENEFSALIGKDGMTASNGNRPTVGRLDPVELSVMTMTYELLDGAYPDGAANEVDAHRPGEAS